MLHCALLSGVPASPQARPARLDFDRALAHTAANVDEDSLMEPNTRRIAGLLLAGGVAVSGALAAQQMDPADMQRLMEQAQGLQTCLARIDQDQLDELRQRGESIAGELKSMCAAGQRDAAQARAVEYGREFSPSPLFESLGECGEQVKSMMEIPMVAETLEGKTQHVCDSGL